MLTSYSVLLSVRPPVRTHKQAAAVFFSAKDFQESVRTHVIGKQTMPPDVAAIILKTNSGWSSRWWPSTTHKRWRPSSPGAFPAVSQVIGALLWIFSGLFFPSRCSRFPTLVSFGTAPLLLWLHWVPLCKHHWILSGSFWHLLRPVHIRSDRHNPLQCGDSSVGFSKTCWIFITVVWRTKDLKVGPWNVSAAVFPCRSMLQQ